MRYNSHGRHCPAKISDASKKGLFGKAGAKRQHWTGKQPRRSAGSCFAEKIRIYELRTSV
jgi:hypothetical protein